MFSDCKSKISGFISSKVLFVIPLYKHIKGVKGCRKLIQFTSQVQSHRNVGLSLSSESISESFFIFIPHLSADFISAEMRSIMRSTLVISLSLFLRRLWCELFSHTNSSVRSSLCHSEVQFCLSFWPSLHLCDTHLFSSRASLIVLECKVVTENWMNCWFKLDEISMHAIIYPCSVKHLTCFSSIAICVTVSHAPL